MPQVYRTTLDIWIIAEDQDSADAVLDSAMKDVEAIEDIVECEISSAPRLDVYSNNAKRLLRALSAHSNDAEPIT